MSRASVVLHGDDDLVGMILFSEQTKRPVHLTSVRKGLILLLQQCSKGGTK